MSNLIQLTLLGEIVKAINEHDYDLDAQLLRDGRLHVSYSERSGRSIYSSQTFSLTLKVDE